LRGGVDTDNMGSEHMEEETVEFLIKEVETILQD